MSKTKWPETVPILEAKDFCRGDFTKGSRHCLAGWQGKVFYDEPESVKTNSRSWKVLLSEVNRELGYDDAIITDFNDSQDTTGKTLARIWNRAMARLGYTENNPEAKAPAPTQPSDEK